MSLDRQRTNLVLSVIQKLVAEGHGNFRPGDVTSRLQAQNQPMGAWEVRGELSKLEAEGLIEVDPKTAVWRMTRQKSLKAG